MPQPCHRGEVLGFQMVDAMCGICGRGPSILFVFKGAASVALVRAMYKDRATHGTDGHKALNLQYFPAVAYLWHLWHGVIHTGETRPPISPRNLRPLLASRSQLIVQDQPH